MIRHNLKRVYLIKRFKKDVIGLSLFKRKNIFIKKFLLRLRRRKKIDFYKIGFMPRPLYFKRKTKFCKYFLRRQQFRLFYSFIKIKILRKLMKKSFKKYNSVNLFLYLFESRLDVLLYRLNLVSSLRMARSLIYFGYIFVNDRVEKKYYYNLKENDILNFHIDIFYFLKKKLINNLKKKKYLLLKFPFYLEYDLNRLFFIFSTINKFDFYFLFRINIYSFFSLMSFYRRCIF